MKQYSIFHVPFMSFFSKALYRDVCFHWKRVGFGYLLLLLIVCWIPRIMKIHSGLNEFVENEVPPMVAQVPTITFKNGEASVDVPQPYMIPDANDVIGIIDTTGEITSLNETDAFFLLTKTQLIYKENEYKTETFDLSELGDMVIDQNLINKWIGLIKSWVVPVICVFAIPGSYIFRIIQALIYGAIGLLFANMCKSQRSYASLVRLAVVAVTPVIIVGTVLSMAGLTLPFSGLLGFAAAMGLLYFGVKACADDDEENQYDAEQPSEVLSAMPEMTPGPIVYDDDDLAGG